MDNLLATLNVLVYRAHIRKMNKMKCNWYFTISKMKRGFYAICCLTHGPADAEYFIWYTIYMRPQYNNKYIRGARSLARVLILSSDRRVSCFKVMQTILCFDFDTCSQLVRQLNWQECKRKRVIDFCPFFITAIFHILRKHGYSIVPSHTNTHTHATHLNKYGNLAVGHFHTQFARWTSSLCLSAICLPWISVVRYAPGTIVEPNCFHIPICLHRERNFDGDASQMARTRKGRSEREDKLWIAQPPKWIMELWRATHLGQQRKLAIGM